LTIILLISVINWNELEPDEIDQIRKATNRDFALRAKRFQDEISIMLGRRAFPGKAGRPRKNNL